MPGAAGRCYAPGEGTVSDETQMHGPGHEFETTSWTLVRSAGSVEALDTLVRLYWKPLYFFVRQHGCDNEEAKDVVQEFLMSMLERGTLSKADPARGRFRTFLLSAMTNFLRDRAKSASREKRGGSRSIFSLDFAGGEEEFRHQVASGDRPEEVLTRSWAKEVWTQAISELKGDPAHLEAFRLYLGQVPYPEITRKTGLTDDAAKMAVHRGKAQLRDIVVATLRQTVSSQEDLVGEVTYFLSILAREGSASGLQDL